MYDLDCFILSLRRTHVTGWHSLDDDFSYHPPVSWVWSWVTALPKWLFERHLLHWRLFGSCLRLALSLVTLVPKVVGVFWLRLVSSCYWHVMERIRKPADVTVGWIWNKAIQMMIASLCNSIVIQHKLLGVLTTTSFATYSLSLVYDFWGVVGWGGHMRPHCWPPSIVCFFRWGTRLGRGSECSRRQMRKRRRKR